MEKNEYKKEPVKALFIYHVILLLLKTSDKGCPCFQLAF